MESARYPAARVTPRITLYLLALYSAIGRESRNVIRLGATTFSTIPTFVKKEHI